MKIQKALALSYELHKNQKRKGKNVPYYVHILDTAKYLMYETSDEDLICAGILHDSIEDTYFTLANLKEEFGERVASLVNFCSEPDNWVDINKDERKKSWRKRKENTVEKIKIGNDDELLVFLADKLSNILSIEEDTICERNIWIKFNASKEEIEWYYKTIRDYIEPRLGDKRIFKIYNERVKRLFG